MAADKNNAAITDSIYQTKNNWVDAILETVIRAGIEEPAEPVSPKPEPASEEVKK
jgi:hypothetical protein